MKHATNTINAKGLIVLKESKLLRKCLICSKRFKAQRQSVMCCSYKCGIRWRSRNNKK